MFKVSLNASGADGGGSISKIYQTADYEYPWRGVMVMHGSFETAADDRRRIEVVELCLQSLDIRVRADDVRVELQALLTANKAWGALSDDHESRRQQAFTDLQTAVFRVASQGITLKLIEQLVLNAYTEGKRDGTRFMQKRFRELLGLEP